MGQRIDLDSKLREIIGSTNVYFQPPTNIKMKYPAIVYKLSNINEKFADDKLYLSKKCYTITVMDLNPDSLIPDKVSQLPLTSFDRYFSSDGLNHYVYSVYY